MIVGRMAKHSHALLALLIILVVSSLVLGMNVPPQSDIAPPDAPAVEADSSPSVTCTPFGLYGDITTPPVVDRLSDSSDNLTFVGTTNGLYVVTPGGKLQHFLYSPFGIKHMALIDDITGDGIREVVVALNDTQVPALRCYDGATWEKLWQFAPVAKIWDRLWVGRQLSITSLGVVEDGDSQRVVITSGRSVLSVNAKDGTEQWRFSAPRALGQMTTVADLNGDDTDEVFVGSDDGSLYLLSGKTGEAQWRTKLPKRSVNGEVIESAADDILPLDRAAGRVAVVSRDGLARIFDLRNRTVEWAVSVSDDRINGWRITLVPDITLDGLPEMLVTYASSYGQGMAYEEGVVLFDSDGNKLWDKNLYVWHDIGAEVGSFGGRPVILEPKGQELRLIDIKDGETVVKTIPIATADGQAPMVNQLGETSFLLISSGSDLAVVSASGEMLWNYPRVTRVKAEGGNFVGDGTEDILFWGESGSQQSSGSLPVVEVKDGMTVVTDSPGYTPQVAEPEVRLLKMMDGATRTIAWSYEVPFSELKAVGGLKGIRVIPDLVGSDNVQDIIGYRENTVFIFSGKNGTPSSFPAGQPIASLDVIRNGAFGNAIAVGQADGLMIFDSTGTQLWATTSTEWVEDESGSFTVLDDVNSDNVSDLAVISADKIVLLKSAAGAAGYELHMTFKAETGYSISYAEVVPDADKDGVRELACIQRAESKQQGGQYSPPGCPLLLEKSPVNGKDLFKVQLPASWPAYDLACGDFNGDGYADSLFSYYPGDICGSAAPSQQGYSGGEVNLWVLSGKNGATLQTHSMKTNPYGGPGGGEPPAINVGDVNGDGADDLVCSVDPRVNGYPDYYEDTQMGLEVYSVAQNVVLNSIPTTPLLKGGLGGYGNGKSTTMLRADVDADGRMEVIAGVIEPSTPSYNPDTNGYPYSSQNDQYFAVVDLDSGQRLAAFMGFDPASISLFETHQPGILGVAACGGACFLRMNADLQVTSPEDGARTGPTVGVRWEGPSDGDFSQVFVDGVRNDITNGFGADLYLGRGEHAVVVRSVDDCGRISYGPSDLSSPLTIRVTPSPWKPVLLVLSLFVLLAVIVLLFYARLHRTWRARRRVAK
jgi:outer membrane protein assembly factor BamB